MIIIIENIIIQVLTSYTLMLKTCGANDYDKNILEVCSNNVLL